MFTGEEKLKKETRCYKDNFSDTHPSVQSDCKLHYSLKLSIPSSNSVLKLPQTTPMLKLHMHPK